MVNRLRYEGGTGAVVILLMECVGNETSIADCDLSLPSILLGCDHSRDVSVTCGRSPVQHGNFDILLLSQ